MLPAPSRPAPARIPRPSLPSLPLPRRRTGVFPSALLLPLAALLLLGGCETVAVYQPVDSEAMAGRSVAVLKPTFAPPVSLSLHKRIVDQVEARLLKFPHLGRVLSRQEVGRVAAGNRKLIRNYDLYSDTLTVVGVSDRQGSALLGKSLGVEMLLGVQLFYMPCPQCEFGSHLGFVVALVEAESGKLLWRGHFRAPVPDDENEARGATAGELVESFFVVFDEDLRPKWHRLRFANLSRLGS